MRCFAETKLVELPPIPARHDAERSTSGRMPAEQKPQDAVFCGDQARRASADPSSATARQDAERSTSGRMPAEQKPQDAVFCGDQARRASADPGSA
jgi:hypothetical protein